MSGLQFAGITIIAIVMLALVGIGVYNISRGLRVLPTAETLGQEPVWHKQPNVLLGISNIAFAVLVGLVALLGAKTNSTGKALILALIVIVFLLSVLLVVRTAMSALSAVKNLRERQSNKKEL